MTRIFCNTSKLLKLLGYSLIFSGCPRLIQIDLNVGSIYDIMSVLQNKKLEVGLPTGLNGLSLFLFQQGIDLYADDGWRINLDSHEALSAFESYMGFFQMYSSPV